METKDLKDFSAEEIKQCVQKIRDFGEYVVIYSDGTFSRMVHGVIENIYTFEYRIELLNLFLHSKYDLSLCTPNDIICFCLNYSYFQQ